MKKYRLKRRLSILISLILLLSTILPACSSDISSKTELESIQDTVEEKVAEGDNKEISETDLTEPSPVEFEWPEDFSLKDTYKEDFLLGTIYTDFNRNGADKELTLKHFDTITPENLMKPEYMQPIEGNFNYNNSDVMVQFAKENGLNLIGHTLAWHQQTGNWLGQNVSREVAIEQLKSHITNIVEHYKGKFVAFDVVNEAINDGTSLPEDGDWTKCLRQTQWLKSIGPDYLALAFTFAREADPDLKLYYNDYNLNSKNKADIVYAMVKDFKEQGIPIDGVGMQGHYSTGMPIGSVEYSIKKFAELGVEVSITELDVTVKDAAPTGLTKEQEVAQAITYAELFKLFKENKDTIARVTFWGYLDSRSWRKESFPCLFHADYTPKEAVYAVLNPEMYLKLSQKEELKVEVKTLEAKYGTPTIDAEMDEVWNSCTSGKVDGQLTAWEGATGKVRVLWDESYIYALFEVQDSLLNAQSVNAYEQDSVEFFLDQNNGKTGYYEEDDGQYRVNFDGIQSFGVKPTTPGFTSAAKKTSDGYLVEMAIPLVKSVADGMVMGFEAQVNDSNASGMRQSIAKFNDMSDNSYQSTEKWGNVKLVK